MNKLKIFNNNINNNYKLIPFNLKLSDYREKYEAPISKEWKNTVYFFDKNNLKNIPLNDLNLNKIIKSYFNLHLKNKFLHLKRMSLKRRNSLLRRIYVSNIEIKHTNNKAIITLYVINTQKNTLRERYKKSKLFYRDIKIEIGMMYENISLFIKDRFTFKGSKISEYKTELNKIVNSFDAYINKYVNQNIFNKLKFIKKINIIRKYTYAYKLDRFKFQEIYFLYKLNNLLTKILNKKIEYNIINLKSLTYNSDIFTKALALKLRKRKFNVLRGINSIINRAKFPKVNTVIERADLSKYKDLYLVQNKYKDPHLLSNLDASAADIGGLGFAAKGAKASVSTGDFFKFLKNMYNLHDKDLKLHTLRLTTTDLSNPSYNLIAIDNKLKNRVKISMFNSIRYKNMGGIRLEIRGRLTRRYRADRALYKLKWKGGLKNFESSFNKLSSVLYRGYLKPNVTYSIANSKRRIGAFAVKGWISGK